MVGITYQLHSTLYQVKVLILVHYSSTRVLSIWHQYSDLLSTLHSLRYRTLCLAARGLFSALASIDHRLDVL
jgi:hypothetical protein